MKKYLVTFYERRNDDKVDFSFTVLAKTKRQAICKIKNGEGDKQLQVPSRLARGFEARLYSDSK